MFEGSRADEVLGSIEKASLGDILAQQADFLPLRRMGFTHSLYPVLSRLLEMPSSAFDWFGSNGRFLLSGALIQVLVTVLHKQKMTKIEL